MEREELLGKVEESLGSYKITSLSEQTINGELDDALAEVEDDAAVDDKFVEKIANRFKRMDGNLHKDVATQANKWKEDFAKKNRQTPKPKGEEHQGEDEAPAWFKAYKAEQDARFEKMENDRKEDAAAKKKDAIAEEVRKGIKAKLKDAGVETREYFLKQALRDADIREDSDAKTLIKDVERDYYRNLKEAGVAEEDSVPRNGNLRGKGKGKSDMDAFFARKKDEHAQKK